MIKYKNLNNVSDKLLQLIPEMPDEVVFQMLNGSPNNDFDRSEREKNPLLYGKTQLSTYFRIKDPEGGRMVDVGVPMEIQGDVVTSYRPFLAGQHEGDIFKGKFSLRKGNVQDEEFYQIFWLSPERQGSPFQDQRTTPKFKIVNYQEESKQAITKVDILRKALNDVATIKEDQVREFAASQNWPETDIDSLNVKINEFAKTKPDVYNKIREDKDTPVKANIKKAIDTNVLSFDPVSGVVKLGDSDITVVSKENRVDYLSAIASWINTAKNGKDVYDGIVKQLSKSA